MPWDETTRMTQRIRFVSDFESCLYTMTELCRRYGVSRKTGYKWAQRFCNEGYEGLAERSRAPRNSPLRTPDELQEALVELRRRRPTWGPRKLLAWLKRRRPEVVWPAASTIGGILKRRGMVEARPRVRRSWPPVSPSLTVAEAANDVWTSDFKGQFRTSDGRLCFPLTVVDEFSRFVLEIRGMSSVAAQPLWPRFERLFEQYGLPQVIRTDNGSPFGAASPGGLTWLSVQWIKLGIRAEKITRGHPEQNGRHERMHRTLKAETARPPAADGSAQQKRFDAFRRCFNEDRPHQALGQRPPAEFYRPSRRPYPGRIPKPEYPGHYEVRIVSHAGEIGFRRRGIFVTEALRGEEVGLDEYADGQWAVYFGEALIGRFDGEEGKLYG
jgi:putative transposase